MNKKANKYLIKFLIISFIFFLIVYFTNETGYYEYKIYTRTKQIEESIYQFEQDLKNNKDITQKDYITIEETNYSNKFSKTGSKIGELLEKLINSLIKKSLELLSDLFYK